MVKSRITDLCLSTKRFFTHHYSCNKSLPLLRLELLQGVRSCHALLSPSIIHDVLWSEFGVSIIRVIAMLCVGECRLLFR